MPLSLDGESEKRGEPFVSTLQVATPHLLEYDRGDDVAAPLLSARYGCDRLLDRGVSAHQLQHLPDRPGVAEAGEEDRRHVRTSDLPPRDAAGEAHSAGGRVVSQSAGTHHRPVEARVLQVRSEEH